MITEKEVHEFLDRQRWTFAKTYAEFAPHEYIVRERLSPQDQKLYPEVFDYVLAHGFHAYFGKAYRTYYEYDGRYYWFMTTDVNVSKILNRCYLDEYCMKFRGYKQLGLEE